MTSTGRSAAVSHVGKIRANNQDSGYAGEHLFVVADGMGGHAGGDVASAIAVTRIREADTLFDNGDDAAFALQTALLAANALITETVLDHPELTGMGTTVTAISRIGSRIALAHIGDSRLYLLRGGVLEQITADHTFVQRLVDSGRITPEEAAVHPRRSVLMRVLGDVDAAPEIDTAVLEVKPGDRWLLCSDGLSSYVTDDKIRAALRIQLAPETIADRLVKEALDQGAPDNVTVVIMDVGDDDFSSRIPPQVVGSAAEPLSYDPSLARKSMRLPSLLLHPLKATHEDSHFEPESEEYFDQLILEDQRRRRLRKVVAGIAIAVIAASLVALGAMGYRWTQTHYFVGTDQGTVAIFQGVQQDLGPIKLSSVVEPTTVRVEKLSPFEQQQVKETITADSLADARKIVKRLSYAE